MGKIQSLADVNEMLDSLQDFERIINDYFENFNNALETFRKNEIVVSFFEAGPYGKEQENKIIKLKAGAERYYNAINGDANSLIQMTKNALNSQRDLLLNPDIAVNKGGGHNLSSTNMYVGRTEELK